MAQILRSPKTSWLWLVIRLYLGYQWMEAGFHKLTGGFDASGFLKGAIAKAVAAPGAKPVVQVWWADFLREFALPNVKMFNVLIPMGELLVGLALILGVVTIFAAVMGMIMNFSFLMSGTTSINPNLLALEVILVTLGGAYAGYIGLDYWVRPWYKKLTEKTKREIIETELDHLAAEQYKMKDL